MKRSLEQRFVIKFCEGREEVADEPRSGRPTTARTDENVDRVLEVLRTDRRLSIQQIADTLHMSTFVVHGIVTEDLQMRKVCAKFVPKVLTQDQKELRVLRCQELLDLIQNEPGFLNSVVTGDESWMFEYDQESKRQSCAWYKKSSPRPKKARMSKSRFKTMIIVFFDIRGIVHCEFVPQGQTVNSAFYLEVLRRLKRRIARVRTDIKDNVTEQPVKEEGGAAEATEESVPEAQEAPGAEGSLQILLDFKVDDQLYSDHHPLVLTIKGQNFNEKKTKREDYNITRYRLSADGLAMFKMKLEELREKNIPASDDLVYTFNQRILEAMSSAKITYSIKGGPRKSKPWFDKDCYDMKKLAKESLKKYRKTNRLEDRECYASSRKKYLALLDLKRKGFDNEKQEILRNAKDSKTFWKTIALYKSTSIIQGEISIQDWLNFYRELMTTEKNLRICNLHNVISQKDPILDSEITNADIYKEIAGLRSNKACGPDGIPNEVLKTLPDSYILLLKQLYNSVMTTGKCPAIWTNSTIHPIFKNGYKNSPSNY
ncbi:hypothetical protein LAZ67_16002322 [Cordylochernes scorpioides]|uniref:Transposase n=1 Tax=Cordylochernes scorpioides TaxID=51811 RepID=A0ABY6LD65_9ARAC|nr:hypothetical protein LAZ67_16002322 [Cordylochernes scorpioides]